MIPPHRGEGKGLTISCLSQPRPCKGLLVVAVMGKSPDELRQVMVPLIGRDVCNQADWYSGNITLGMVCAGYEEGGRGSCHVSDAVGLRMGYRQSCKCHCLR